MPDDYRMQQEGIEEDKRMSKFGSKACFTCGEPDPTFAVDYDHEKFKHIPSSGFWFREGGAPEKILFCSEMCHFEYARTHEYIIKLAEAMSNEGAFTPAFRGSLRHVVDGAIRKIRRVHV